MCLKELFESIESPVIELLVLFQFVRDGDLFENDTIYAPVGPIYHMADGSTTNMGIKARRVRGTHMYCRTTFFLLCSY